MNSQSLTNFDWFPTTRDTREIPESGKLIKTFKSSRDPKAFTSSLSNFRVGRQRFDCSVAYQIQPTRPDEYLSAGEDEDQGISRIIDFVSLSRLLPHRKEIFSRITWQKEEKNLNRGDDFMHSRFFPVAEEYSWEAINIHENIGRGPGGARRKKRKI